MSRSRYGHADAFNVEEVPVEARAKALAFAIEHYRRLRDAKKTPKVAYQKTWYATQQAAYGLNSKFGYFIRYAHQIGEIVGEAQRVVEGARASTKQRRPRGSEQPGLLPYQSEAVRAARSRPRAKFGL